MVQHGLRSQQPHAGSEELDPKRQALGAACDPSEHPALCWGDGRQLGEELCRCRRRQWLDPEDLLFRCAQGPPGRRQDLNASAREASDQLVGVRELLEVVQDQQGAASRDRRPHGGGGVGATCTQRGCDAVSGLGARGARGQVDHPHVEGRGAHPGPPQGQPGLAGPSRSSQGHEWRAPEHLQPRQCIGAPDQRSRLCG